MLSFLFWNLSRKSETAANIARLAAAHSVDALLLAECPKDTAGILGRLNGIQQGRYWIPDNLSGKVQVATRLPESDIQAIVTSVGGDMTVWRVRRPTSSTILLAVVHLPAKSGGVTDNDQQACAEIVANEIRNAEDEARCQDMTKMLAAKDERGYRGESYRRFYNPMWGLFGDRTPGPPGTYFWRSSVMSNHHWHMLDQVLLRPSLMERLRDLRILDDDGEQSLCASSGYPGLDHLSDHLPVFFSVDV